MSLHVSLCVNDTWWQHPLTVDQGVIATSEVFDFKVAGTEPLLKVGAGLRTSVTWPAIALALGGLALGIVV